MKTLAIIAIILLGLFDYALCVMCSHMERQEEYWYEQIRKEKRRE